MLYPLAGVNSGVGGLESVPETHIPVELISFFINLVEFGAHVLP